MFADPLPYWNSGNVARSQGSGSRPQSVLKPNFETAELLAQNAASRADHYSRPSRGNWFSPEVNQNVAASQAAGHYLGVPGEIHSPQSAHWGQGFVENPEYGVMYPHVPSNDAAQEPFFTDLSALMPVYTSSSRSRYQRGRAVFAQTRYIPGDPVYPSMPVVYSYSQRSGEETGPAAVPNKGVF